MMQTIQKWALIGLGNRGNELLRQVLLPMCEAKEIEICAVCDRYADRVQAGAGLVQSKTGMRPMETKDYREILQLPTVEAVLIATGWEMHVPIAVDAMRAGKTVGMEVGGAYTVEDCWRLVEAYEQTGTPLMLLENCCYGQRELMVLNMVRQGVFGEIVHCAGGYHHDLRAEITTGEEKRHYRLHNYRYRNCENYPTHELGPIAQVLNIHRGNRMLTLTSTASAARGLAAYVAEQMDAAHPLQGASFAQGDIVTTVIRCAGGQTITLTLDTTLPRSYSRDFTVRGTKGAYFESTDTVFLDGVHAAYEFNGKALWNNAAQYEAQYQHPLWQEYTPQGSHGGMDRLVMEAFREAVAVGGRPPIDVYDAAAWMSITALSEMSIARGGAPVDIPDFTRGQWHLPYRERIKETLSGTANGHLPSENA